MEKIEFKKEINASAKKVWEVLFGEITYPLWTSVFAEGSRAETDWKKGSKALFLDGKGQGMVSVIEESIPNEYLSIKHLGEIKDGKEDLSQDWGNALENYTLREKGDKVELKVDMSITDDWKEYFEKIWPQALDKVKELAESKETFHVET